MNNTTTAQMTDEELDAHNLRALDEMRYEDVVIRLSLVPAANMYPTKNIFEIAW